MNRNYYEIKAEVMEMAQAESLSKALDYAYTVFGAYKPIFEELMKIDSKTLRNQMYKNALTKPYVHWLKIFLELEDERIYNKTWSRKKANSNNEEVDRSVANNLSYHIYKNYSRKEIVERFSEMLCEENDVYDAVWFLEEELVYILHYFELMEIWKKTINHFASLEDTYDLMDLFDGHVRKGTMGYNFMYQFVIEKMC